MTYDLRFLADTEEDIFNGYAWYEEKATGLGEEFKRTVYSSTAEITRNPQIYPKVEDEIRRCLLRRFPYSIYFIIEENTVIICGFFHCARDPEGIKTQISDRKENE
jgi:toxin ParE1/3/4